jgi:hypothetical protein
MTWQNLPIPQCDFPYHLECLDPPLSAVPEGEWFCPKCEQKPGEGKTGGGKRSADDDDDDDDDEEETTKTKGRKRKDAPQTSGPKPKGE